MSVQVFELQEVENHKNREKPIAINMLVACACAYMCVCVCAQHRDFFGIERAHGISIYFMTMQDWIHEDRPYIQTEGMAPNFCPEH